MIAFGPIVLLTPSLKAEAEGRAKQLIFGCRRSHLQLDGQQDDRGVKGELRSDAEGPVEFLL